MTDDEEQQRRTAPKVAEVLVKCEACGQLYDRADPSQVRYHEHPGHKPRQRHNLGRMAG